ncbi:hypothetical protein DPEC_G00319710 [Dallia pectoralis]|uniref:Uncharacterized protein n=1 Tax=Dallia pectoralis TaxID=75939 RepID=A0ACC2F9M5_DALPE|nr:hypothetical protein DPEC_G00319710 [Dallia pectoralis]
MTTSLILTLLFVTGPCLRAAVLPHSTAPEDLDGSGNDLESSSSGDWAEDSKDDQSSNKEDKRFPFIRTDKTRSGKPDDTHLTSDLWPKLGDDYSESSIGNVANSRSFIANKEALAAVIAGGAVGLVLAVALLILLIYHMKKKDWGDTSKGGYLKANTKEFIV